VNPPVVHQRCLTNSYISVILCNETHPLLVSGDWRGTGTQALGQTSVFYPILTGKKHATIPTLHAINCEKARAVHLLEETH
jgi:hypothetical protein